MPAVNRSAPKKTHVQSVVFKKSEWDEKKARTWLKSHGYKTDGFDNAGNYFRFRQFDPDEKTFDYRMKEVDKGIYFVYGFLK